MHQTFQNVNSLPHVGDIKPSGIVLWELAPVLEKWQEQQRYWNNKGIKMASEGPGMSYFIFIYFLGGRLSAVV